MTSQPRPMRQDAPRFARDLGPELVKRGLISPALSVVVPVKNEEESIVPFVERVSAILDSIGEKDGWEILFVDDGSNDSTLAAIVAANQRDKRVRALSLSRNFGKEAALSAGLDHARGRAVIPMDVDMQDPPEVLPEMVAKWRDGFEMVFGVRRCRKEDSLPKRVTAGLYYRAHNFVSEDKIPANAGDFRLLSPRAANDTVLSGPSGFAAALTRRRPAARAPTPRAIPRSRCGRRPAAPRPRRRARAAGSARAASSPGCGRGG